LNNALFFIPLAQNHRIRNRHVGGLLEKVDVLDAIGILGTFGATSNPAVQTKAVCVAIGPKVLARLVITLVCKTFPSGQRFANAVSLFVRLVAGEGERPIARLVDIAGLSRLLPAKEAAGHVLELHHSVSGGTKLLPKRHVRRELLDAQGRSAVRSALFHIAIVAKRTLKQKVGTLVQ